MTEPESGEEEATLFPKTAGEKLRESRIAQGLSLADVAARTRVPMRHLEAIELSDFSGLPSATYSVGFAKAYARAIGMDEVMIGREVRGQAETTPRPPEYQPYEMNDPKRLPPRGLTTVLAIVAVLIVIGVAIFYGTSWFRGDETPATAAAPVETVAPPPTAPPSVVAPAAGGAVVLTATDVVWLRVYDTTGKTLFQGELKPGEHFDVPADAVHPMINVGRPDQIQVTVNGSIVPPLGAGNKAIKDVEISAQALLARGQAVPTQPGDTTTIGNSTAPITTTAAPAAKPRRDRPASPRSTAAPTPSETPPDRTAPAATAPAGNATTPTGAGGAGELPQP